METGERLAAYLSGDLDADEHAALEAELADDPALRARLERIRRADAALADLPDEELPDGFEDRLHHAVAGELDTLLGHDELAARRDRRAAPRWVPAVAAAAAVLVIGGGVVLTGGMGGEDSDEAATLDGAAEETLESGADQDAGGDEMQADEAEAASAPVGPRVVDADRTLDDQSLSELAADSMVLDALGGRAIGDPTAVAEAYAEALGALPGEYDAPESGSEDDGDDAGRDTAGAERGEAVETDDLTVVSEGRLDEEGLADVARCLPTLQDEAVAPVVPLYAELGTDADDTPVIAYAALAPDDQGDYRRVEVWLVERDSCSLLRFVQHDR